MIKNIIMYIQNNQAIAISLLSLTLSLYNFFYSLYVRHKKIKIDLITYLTTREKELFRYNFCINISNCSQLPISINSLCINDIFCTHNKTYFKRQRYTQNNYTMVQEDTFTFQFPINLNSLEATSGYIELLSNQELNFNNLNFKVYTNRGCIKNLKSSKLNLINDKDTDF